MAGRASVFSNETIIALLSEQFIPVAEDSSALERQQDDKGEFFRHIAEQGHYGGRTHPTSTRQGSYTFTADGRFLAAVNTRDPEQMAAMAHTAIERWQQPEGLSEPSPAQLVDTASPDAGYPADGLVLELAARDLPRDDDTRPDDWRKGAWNRDYAWFTRAEAVSLVPSGRDIGSVQEAPARITRRLARFHLRDFVRGEPYAWPEEALQHAELHAEVTAVDGDEIYLTLRAAIRLDHEAHWVRPEDGEERRYRTGFDARLTGEAVWNDRQHAFTAFDLLATGPRWGANQYNNRDDDLGPAPLGIAFKLAGKTPADRTAPHLLRTWRTAKDGSKGRVAIEDTAYFR